MLEMKNISKTFEDRSVIAEVKLVVPKGAPHALDRFERLGKNKPRLLRNNYVGLIPFDKGYVKIQRSGAAVVHGRSSGPTSDTCHPPGRRAVSAIYFAKDNIALDREADAVGARPESTAGGETAQARGLGFRKFSRGFPRENERQARNSGASILRAAMMDPAVMPAR